MLRPGRPRTYKTGSYDELENQIFANMSKSSEFGSIESQRHLINGWATIDKLSGIDIHKKLVDHFGENSVKLRRVQEVIKQIKEGRTDMANKKSPGRPRTEHIDQNVARVKGMLSINNTVTIQAMSQHLDLSTHVVFNILRELQLSKLSCRYVKPWYVIVFCWFLLVFCCVP